MLKSKFEMTSIDVYGIFVFTAYEMHARGNGVFFFRWNTLVYASVLSQLYRNTTTCTYYFT